MKFADILLRLGCALVAWMMIYGYVVWLAVLHAVDCDVGRDDMHRLLLGMAPATALAALLLGAARPYPEIDSLLRWLSLPLILLLPLVSRNVYSYGSSILLGAPLCSSAGVQTWQEIWAPVQIMTLAWMTFLVVRRWRQTRPAASDPGHDPRP